MDNTITNEYYDKEFANIRNCALTDSALEGYLKALNVDQDKYAAQWWAKQLLMQQAIDVNTCSVESGNGRR